MQCSSRISACRRDLNSHDAAKPREDSHPLRRTRRQGAVKCERTERHSINPSLQPKRGLVRAGMTHDKEDEEPLCHIAAPSCVGTAGFQSVRRAAAASDGESTLGRLSRRLECVAGRGHRRGAGSPWCGPRGVTGPWQAHRRRSRGAVLPNPSLKGSANGMPPGPGRRYPVHCRQPGPGVLPLAPP